MQVKTVEREKYTEEDYDAMLDDCYDEVNVCGYKYSPSYALKEMDPTAYRCGFSDFQEEETVYVCGECGEEFDDESEAEDCCKIACDVCGELYETVNDAVSCCEESDEDDEL